MKKFVIFTILILFISNYSIIASATVQPTNVKTLSIEISDYKTDINQIWIPGTYDFIVFYSIRVYITGWYNPGQGWFYKAWHRATWNSNYGYRITNIRIRFISENYDYLKIGTDNNGIVSNTYACHSVGLTTSIQYTIIPLIGSPYQKILEVTIYVPNS